RAAGRHHHRAAGCHGADHAGSAQTAGGCMIGRRIQHARTRVNSRVRSRGRIPVRIQGLGVSTRVSPWTTALIMLLLTGCLGLGAWSMTLGDYPITVGEVAGAVVGDPAAPQDSFIVNGLRLPRVVVALLAGAALAASGAI